MSTVKAQPPSFTYNGFTVVCENNMYHVQNSTMPPFVSWPQCKQAIDKKTNGKEQGK